MLTLYTAAGAVPLRCDDYYVKELASGYDEVCFEISIWSDQYPLIQEEASLVEKSDLITSKRYLIKAIDGSGERAMVKAQIDLDEWKTTMTIGYKSASATVAAIISSVKPNGWAVIDRSGLTYRRTIALDSATPLDVVEQCRDTFQGVTFVFDNILRTITIINLSTFTSVGAFATRDLNLQENNYIGKSTGFVTRLYAYGKDGLSFASINSGKAYVENHTYSDRVICGYWKDERYTIPENLMAAAQAKVDELAVPQRSYECTIVDLAAVDVARYGYLDFSLFTTITLIDATREASGIPHQIVERWIYPNLPQNNKVILSTTAPRIQSQVSQILDSFSNPNSVIAQQQQSAQEAAVARATAQITGASGGYMRNIYDAAGNWIEQVIMDTQDILTATKVWRWNMGGLGYSSNGYNGPYGTAITQNGEIVADFITTGTLNAALAEIININASNIATGTLSADRISAHSLAVSKITGALTGGLSSSWGIDFDTGTLTIGNISANNITAGTLSADRIGANTIAVSKLTGSISNGNWKIDFDAGTMSIGELSVSKVTGNIANGNWKIDFDAGTFTIGNISANNITVGTLDAARIAANSIAVSKLTGSITGGISNSWEINLTNGTLTIGNISASNITTGTLNASNVTVTNLNADNITVGTLNVARIANGSITGSKIGQNTITGGSLGNLALSTITGGNVGMYEISGGVGGNIGYTNNGGIIGANLELSTISDAYTDDGINTGLGYAHYAAGVFSGVQRANYLMASYVSASDQLIVGGYDAVWQYSSTLGGYVLMRSTA